MNRNMRSRMVSGYGQEKFFLFRKQKGSLEALLAKAKVEGAEQEKRRVAKELHDNIGQLLVVLKHELAESPTQSQARELINTLIEEVRNTTKGLKPKALQCADLREALNKLCNNLSKRYKIRFQLEYNVFRTLDDFEILNLYRIVQEACCNIIKYAQAGHVLISLLEVDDHVALKVFDDGIGLSKAPQGYGLEHMKERAEAIGGQLEIHSKPQAGTFIHLKF
ncbi:MAG: sensor histidine kinase [Bacteroidota bacterium]